jgi:hypothetical protein
MADVDSPGDGVYAERSIAVLLRLEKLLLTICEKLGK